MEVNEKINEKKEVCEHKNRQKTNYNSAAARPKDRTGIHFHDDGPFWCRINGGSWRRRISNNSEHNPLHKNTVQVSI